MRHFTIRCVLSLAVLLSFPASGVSGQTPVGFLPGLNGSPTEWTNTGSALASQFNISPFYPNYNPDDVFNTNRATLGALDPTTILVGHSAGGVLARYKGQQQGLGGVVTYGSPNYGAPLEETYPVFCDFVGGTLFDAARVANAVNFLIDGQWIFDDLNPDYDFIVNETLGGVCDGVALAINYPGLPAGAELGPDAAFINDTLDAAANIATEEGNVAQEASVVVTANNYYDSGFYRVWFGDGTGSAVGHIAQDLGSSLEVLGASIEYDYQDDPDMLDVAADLEDLGDDLLFMDDAWCESVSGSLLCYPNDEAVPTWSQALGRGYEVDDGAGPIHTEEVQNSTAHLVDVLNHFDIGAPGGGGGGGGSDSVSVSMSGPTNVKPGATCEWFATVTGGTAPYSYYWTPGGYSGGGDYDYTNSVSDGGSFTMALTVTDANGAHGTTSELVHVHSTALECPL